MNKATTPIKKKEEPRPKEEEGEDENTPQESFQPRKIDFDSMLDFDPTTPLFGSDFKKEQDLNNKKLQELTQDQQEEEQPINEEERSTLEDLEQEELEKNRNIIASTSRGRKKQAKEGNYMSSLRDPLLEEEKKEKKAKYEAATYEAKVKKAELESLRTDNEITKEKEFLEAKRKAELEQLQGTTKKPAPTPGITDPNLLQVLIKNSTKPDGTIDPINMAMMSSLLGGGSGNGLDINNLLLMQLLGGNNSAKPTTPQSEPLEFNKLLIMMVLKLFEQMNSRSFAPPPTTQPHSELAAILPVITQLQNQNITQQQTLFQTMIQRLLEEKNELKEQLYNNNPLEEVKRSAETIRSLGMLGQNIPIEAQIKLKEIEHNQQMEMLRIQNDQNNQTNFANVLGDLGKKAFESEWLGKTLENIGEVVKQKQSASPQPLPSPYYQEEELPVQPTIARARKQKTKQSPSPPNPEEPQAPENEEISQTINQYLQNLQQQMNPQQPQPQANEGQEEEEEEIISDNEEEQEENYTPVDESDIVQEATYSATNRSRKKNQQEIDLRELDNQSLDTMISQSFGKRKQQ